MHKYIRAFEREVFFFSSRRRHTRLVSDWSSDVCSSDLYRPRYEWTPPTGRGRGRDRQMRPGIEELLAAHGLEYFVADSHLVAAGAPVFLYRDYIPARKEMPEPSPAIPVNEARSPYAPYRVASRGGNGSAIAFIRDPKTTLPVWSRDHGYPGAYAYLEFHKKHFPGGLRF